MLSTTLVELQTKNVMTTINKTMKDFFSCLFLETLKAINMILWLKVIFKFSNQLNIYVLIFRGFDPQKVSLLLHSEFKSWWTVSPSKKIYMKEMLCDFLLQTLQYFQKEFNLNFLAHEKSAFKVAHNQALPWAAHMVKNWNWNVRNWAEALCLCFMLMVTFICPSTELTFSYFKIWASQPSSWSWNCMSFSSHFPNLVFVCFWRWSYQNIT